jgi:two-component system NtrC family sensor kinase
MIIRLTIAVYLYLLFVPAPVAAQNGKSYRDDTARVMQLIDTAQRYRFFKPDSCVPFAAEALRLSTAINFKQGQIAAYIVLGEYHRVSGNFPESLENLFAAVQISTEVEDSIQQAAALGFMGMTYLNLREYRTALDYLFRAYAKKHLLETPMVGFVLSNTGIAYQEMDMMDSALVYQEMAWALAKNTPMAPGKAFVLRALGNIYSQLNNTDSAFYYYRYSLGITNDVLNIGRTYGRMALLYFNLKKYDSTLHYASRSLMYGRLSSQKPIMLEASRLLATCYIKINKLDSAVKYLQLTMDINDSLFGSERLRKVQLLKIAEQKKLFDTEQRQQQIQEEQNQYRNKIRIYILLAILTLLLLFGTILYRNNRRKQMANRLLERQKSETEKALNELKDTQQQLIQSAKMASLGELTAGIAHEIQNPLNFINNFSDVNTELIDEVHMEMDKGNTGEVKAILNDIRENEQKINHHGKRADSIVKGMLQHSRNSSGQKELTDINALVDECMRLSYHGLRAKDKSFNAKTETDLDSSLAKINVAPQDIGRVVLNLFTNAFYSVMQKKKQLGNAFEPIVSVRTAKTEAGVAISIRDNGNGVPQKAVDKIFQPFFTTKPVGEGTGLGLSMSYDIITKGHGGQLKVETKEGEFAQFTIILPTKS